MVRVVAALVSILIVGSVAAYVWGIGWGEGEPPPELRPPIADSDHCAYSQSSTGSCTVDPHGNGLLGPHCIGLEYEGAFIPTAYVESDTGVLPYVPPAKVQQCYVFRDKLHTDRQHYGMPHYGHGQIYKKRTNQWIHTKSGIIDATVARVARKCDVAGGVIGQCKAHTDGTRIKMPVCSVVRWRWKERPEDGVVTEKNFGDANVVYYKNFRGDVEVVSCDQFGILKTRVRKRDRNLSP